MSVRLQRLLYDLDDSCKVRSIYLDPPTFGVSWLDYPTRPAGLGFQTGHPDRRVLVDRLFQCFFGTTGCPARLHWAYWAIWQTTADSDWAQTTLTFSMPCPPDAQMLGRANCTGHAWPVSPLARVVPGIGLLFQAFAAPHFFRISVTHARRAWFNPCLPCLV